jgi:multiple sugar transport system ATP-binding protein
MNLVEGRVEDRHVELAGFRLPVADGAELPGGRVIVGVRPEAFEDATFADPSLPAIDVDVAVIEELGSDTHVIFPVDAPPVDSETLLVREEQEEELTLGGDSAVFNARVDARSAAAQGERLRLAVDPARFHFFDPETGANLTQRHVREQEPAPTSVH